MTTHSITPARCASACGAEIQVQIDKMTGQVTYACARCGRPEQSTPEQRIAQARLEQRARVMLQEAYRLGYVLEKRRQITINFGMAA